MKKTLILSLAFLIFSLSSDLAHAYRDISDHYTLRPAVDYFIDKGILDGQGFFRAEAEIPTAWFWEIVLKEAGFDPESATFLTPVPEGVDPTSELAQYVREAVRRGFIDLDNPFDPEAPIKRLEAIRHIIKTKAILEPGRTSDKFRAATRGVPPTAQYLAPVEAAFASKILELGDLQPLRPYETLKRKDLIRWLYNWEANGQQKVSGLVKTQPREERSLSNRTRFPYESRQKEEAENSSRITIGPSTRATSQNLSQYGQDLGVLLEVLNQIQDKYLHEEELTDENRKNWINHGIEGLVEELEDKYTNYIRPDKAEDYFDSLNGEFEGIGAYVEMIEETFTVRSPIKGSPAEAAGLRPGDIVRAVDGADVSNQSIKETINLIKGPAGTDVTLTIERNGRGRFDVTVTRGRITIPDVTLETHQGIPVVGIHQFNRDTGPHVQTLLKEEVLPKNPRGIIFDLRNNPGGYLTAAVDVGSIFLPSDKIVFSVDYRDDIRDREYRTYQEGMLADFDNIAVLVNKGSASASEIFAGMIQDYDLGKVIGQTSVGKGSVQEITNFSNGGSLKVTVAKWLTPLGRWIDETGIVPDIEITDPTDEEKLNKVDRQLDRAVQAVLRGE